MVMTKMLAAYGLTLVAFAAIDAIIAVTAVNVIVATSKYGNKYIKTDSDGDMAEKKRQLDHALGIGPTGHNP